MDKLDAMTEQVRDFCDARDWRKYHTPKELAIGMATESSELLQLFRFMLSSKLKRNGERYPVDASSNEYRKADHHE